MSFLAQIILSTEDARMANELHSPARKTVLLVGLDPTLIDFSEPDYANFPGLTAEKVMAGLTASRDNLNDLGYESRICVTDFGETALAVLAAQLEEKHWDCVLVGAGVRTVPRHFLLFEKAINLIHERAPQAKICFNTNPADTADAVRRWV